MMTDYLPSEPVQDERGGLSSASGIERIFLCPGSWNLERQCHPLPPSEDAESGTAIHAALAKNDPAGLTDEQTETFMKCLALEAELLQRTFPGEEFQTAVEKRFWNRMETVSGQFDRLHMTAKRGLIIDFKTSRGEVVSAEGNIQLRTLACIAWQSLLLWPITVAIIQPWASPQVSVCEYSDPDLINADEELHRALEAAENPNAPRIPGERQCKYCRGKNRCRERLVSAVNVPVIRSQEGIVALSSEDLGIYLDRAREIESAIADMREEAKARILRGEEVVGWTTRPGAIKSTITDVPEVYQRMKHFIQPEDFAGIVKTTKKDLVALLKAKTGMKGRELELRLDELLEGCTSEKQNAPSLERVK